MSTTGAHVTAPSRSIRHVGFVTKARNLAVAAKEIVAASVVTPSAPIFVPDDVLAVRRAACAACEYHDPAGNLGLGECKHPGCGCTGTKLSFAAMSCPLTPPKWGRYLPSTPPAPPAP